MGNTILQLDYDELAQISKMMRQESEIFENLYQTIRGRMESLRHAWRGEAASRFFAEMDSLVLPSTLRVSRAWDESERALNHIMQIIYQADQETVAYFKGLGDLAGSEKRKTRIYLINGINYAPQTHAEMQNLVDKLKARYGENVEVVIVGGDKQENHPFNTNLQQYARFFFTNFGGFFKPLDEFTSKAANMGLGLLNTVVGAGQVINEYVSGGSTESQKVFEWIQDDLNRNGLIGNSNVDVVLLPHSGGGAIAANIVDDIENRLGVNVSGMVTMGSPFSNYDAASKYAETIIDIRHESDGFGNLMHLGTFRSDEMRIFPGVFRKQPELISFLPSLPAVDNLFINLGMNVTNITTNDQNIPWWNFFAGHGSYFDSDQVVSEMDRLVPN
jgi:WXG100 family type VII secretion target